MWDQKFNFELIHMMLKQTIILTKIESELKFDICD